MSTEQFVEESEASEIFVAGELFSDLPEDLYIPPKALRVILDAFQGPLDLLLYLIRKQNIDILNIPIAKITHQYMQYVQIMKDLNLELAGEYLVMAAILGELKSRCLLPRVPKDDESDDMDPRVELVRRLQAYEQLKKAAHDLNQLPRWERDIFPVDVEVGPVDVAKPLPNVTLDEMLAALKKVFNRASLFEKHAIAKEQLSTRERMTQVLARVSEKSFVCFFDLFDLNEGRSGIVTTFLAILELVKEKLVDVVQTQVFGTLYVQKKLAQASVTEEDLQQPLNSQQPNNSECT